MKSAEELYDMLKKTQEAKGFFFNTDRESVMELLRALLFNRERYGYLCCPCRLASGSREKDRDIICPCDYREEDISDYGSCYCGLYVSNAWNEGTIERRSVPERRPPEKIPY